MGVKDRGVRTTRHELNLTEPPDTERLANAQLSGMIRHQAARAGTTVRRLAPGLRSTAGNQSCGSFVMEDVKGGETPIRLVRAPGFRS